MYSANMLIFFLFISFSHFCIIQSLHLEPARVKRGIFGTATSTVYTTVEDKIYIPASCIWMEPNLTNYCRHVRFLFPGTMGDGFNFFNFGNEITPTTAVALNPPYTNYNIGYGRQDTTQTTVMGWGDYFWPQRPTITVTSTKIVPTTVKDPWVTITYAIRGCKPKTLPKNLKNCPVEDRLELAEIIPTSTVQARIEATKIPEMEDFKIHDAPVESTNIETLEMPENNRATKSL